MNSFISKDVLFALKENPLCFYRLPVTLKDVIANTTAAVKKTRAHGRKGPWFFYYLRYWFPPRIGGRSHWQPTSITYAGVTNNFYKRIRQHNGKISGGAEETKEIRQKYPDGIWLPQYIVEGFGVDDYYVALRFERAHRKVRCRNIIMTPFRNLYYLGIQGDSIFEKSRKRILTPKDKNAFTENNVGVDSHFFLTLCGLALPKWSKYGASPPVQNNFKVIIFQERFLPKQPQLIENLFQHCPWVELESLLSIPSEAFVRQNYIPPDVSDMLPSQ